MGSWFLLAETEHVSFGTLGATRADEVVASFAACKERHFIKDDKLVARIAELKV